MTKKFIKKNGVNGYLDANGKFTQGWVIVSNAKNQVKYINPDGDDFVKNGSKWIDGLLYYFDKNGYRINDLTNIYKQPYYYTVDRVNGVMTVYNAAKTVPVKSIRVSVGLPVHRLLGRAVQSDPVWQMAGSHGAILGTVRNSCRWRRTGRNLRALCSLCTGKSL